MAKIIFSGKTYSTTVADHVSYTNEEYAGLGGGECVSWDGNGNCLYYTPTYPIYNYPTRTTSAVINGTITSNVSDVYVQGVKPAIASSQATETDTFDIPSTATSGGSGNHTDATATLSGNSKQVYINGSLAVVSSSVVNTHVSGVSVTLDETTASSTVNIG